MHAVTAHYESLHIPEITLLDLSTIADDDWQYDATYYPKGRYDAAQYASSTSFWTAEHLARGAIDPEEINADNHILAYDTAQSLFELSLDGYHSTHMQQQALNYQLAHIALRDLHLDRESFNFNSFSDNYVTDIAKSLDERMQDIRHLRTAVAKGSSLHLPGIDQTSGSIFELLLCGIVAESAEFRAARITAIPAPVELEKQRLLGQFIPIDVAFVHIDEENTTELVGGLQACVKGRKSTDGFTATIPRKNVPGHTFIGNIDNHVDNWCAGRGLEEYHRFVYDRVLGTQNARLLQLLEANE